MIRPGALRALACVCGAVLIAGGCVAEPGALSASSGGVTVDAKLDRTDVVAGQAITATVTVTNGGSTDSVVALDCGMPVSIEAVVPVPLLPSGKTWDGVEGSFKTLVLTSGTAPGGTLATDPMIVRAAGSCPDVATEATIKPHGSVSGTAKLVADIVDGLPMPAGPIQVRVTLRHDAKPLLSNQALTPGTPVSVQMKSYQETTATQTIAVTNSAAPMVTLGQAVDSILSDQGFANWLSQTPTSTWTTANAYLVSGGGGGIEPQVPSWDIELFSETDAPRTWAIGFVDAAKGTVLSTTYCNDPCDH